ncbi:hypothetical protein SETIT_2G014900v2 [Setaria italica]|uniref:NB-ARC domain-containing protein n=1 Tax=Setaria italica TaxID=4555 RepID=K4A170_SETIT|nr:hypothetical protein SETIT_2G014900v2 [Setaria italica]
MEMFLSAVLGELSTRSINFFISKISKTTPLDMEDHLSRVLVRAQIIIDEAMGGHISNQAMAIICMLDTFRCQYHEEDTKGHVIINSSALSRLSSLKSLCFYNRDTPISKQLQEGIDELTSMILDAKELVVFLTSYPHLYRQPYCMHLVLGNCLFGRQMESEIVINFLLQTQPYGAEELEVLPIFGPIFVGKSTLVAHACKDERVRDHFSEILFFQNYGFTDDELATLRDGCARIHLNHVSISNKDRRLLVVIELVGDLNEDEWNRLYFASKRFVPCGGKIIVTSRSEKIKKFGTTRAVTLKYLPREAYWYFFKTLAFGSMDPKVQPRLTHLTMEIASTLDGSFIARNFTARSLQKPISRFGERPIDLLKQNRPANLGRMATPSEVFVLSNQYGSAQDKVPKVRLQDVMYGTFKTSGKFELLSWRSSIPPYFSYVGTCEILELKAAGVKRKRSMKDGGKLM